MRKISLKILNLSDLEQGQWMTLTFGTHTASCTHVVDCSVNFYIIAYNSFWKIHCFTFFPYKSTRDQIWPCHKIGHSQSSVIIWTNLVALENPMLHTNFQVHQPFGSREEDFLSFYHLWAWRPYWSCDLNHLYKLSFLNPTVPHEIWLLSFSLFNFIFNIIIFLFLCSDCWQRYMSHLMTKLTKWGVRLVETQISLGISPVRSVFAVRMKKAWVIGYPLSAQQRLWSDWVDAQVDLSLRWAHRPFCWFCHEVAQILKIKLPFFVNVRDRVGVEYLTVNIPSA